MYKDHSQDCNLNEFTGGLAIGKHCTCGAPERKEIRRLNREVVDGNQYIKQLGDATFDYLKLVEEAASKYGCICEVYSQEASEICFSCRCKQTIKKHNLTTVK